MLTPSRQENARGVWMAEILSGASEKGLTGFLIFRKTWLMQIFLNHFQNSYLRSHTLENTK